MVDVPQSMISRHAACDLFPMIEGAEFEALKRDIAEHGQREPIVLVDGALVDGRNRLRACQELGLEPKVRELSASEAGDVFLLVLSLNLHRRHLRPHERGAVLAAYMERVGAKKQQGRRTDVVRDTTSATLAEVATHLGVAEATARFHLAAAQDYAASAPAHRAQVDAGEITAREARRRTEGEQRREAVAVAAEVETPRVTQSLESLVADARNSEAGRFACIYADPPWQYGNQGTRAATDNHYATMTVDEVCALPIGDIAAENAHLHLWTTNAFLFDAKRVMEAWGFTYKSCFVWVKPQMGIGNYWRVSHEFLLFGIRGKCPFLARDAMSWASLPRGRHSSKPHEIRKLIERVSPGPRIELFAREVFEGWSAWGNQAQRSPVAVGDETP